MGFRFINFGSEPVSPCRQEMHRNAAGPDKQADIEGIFALLAGAGLSTPFEPDAIGVGRKDKTPKQNAPRIRIDAIRIVLFKWQRMKLPRLPRFGGNWGS